MRPASRGFGGGGGGPVKPSTTPLLLRSTAPIRVLTPSPPAVPIAGSDMKGMGATGMMGGSMMMGTHCTVNHSRRRSGPVLTSFVGSFRRSFNAGTRAGNRPGSALKRVPTAAGQKPVSDAQAGMIGLSTDVKVEARPLTSGGLTGMATRIAGPGRQLADISYYRADLRNKLIDIQREIEYVPSHTVTDH